MNENEKKVRRSSKGVIGDFWGGEESSKGGDGGRGGMRRYE